MPAFAGMTKNTLTPQIILLFPLKYSPYYINPSHDAWQAGVRCSVPVGWVEHPDIILTG
jgi:hypothetical protein